MLSIFIVYRPTYQKLLPYFTTYQHEQICYILKNSSSPGSAHLQLLELFQSLIVESMGFDDPMALAHLIYEYKEKFLRTKLIRDLKAQSLQVPPKTRLANNLLIEKRKQRKLEILSSIKTKEEGLARKAKNAIVYSWPTEEEKIKLNLSLFSKNPKNLMSPSQPHQATTPNELKVEVCRCYLEVEHENPSLNTSDILRLTCARVRNLGLMPNCSIGEIITIITND